MSDSLAGKFAKDVEIAKALSEHVKSSNRRWTVCAGLALATIAYSPGNDLELLGTKVSSEAAPKLLILALCAAGLAFSVAHSTLVRSMHVFHSSIRDDGRPRESLLGEFTYLDVVYLWVHSAYDRIWPVFSWINESRIRQVLYQILKSIVSSGYLLLPAISIVYCWRFYSIDGEIAGVSLAIGLALASVITVGLVVSVWYQVVVFTLFHSDLSRSKK